MLTPFLSTGTEFDALVLVTRNGSVVAQQSSTGLELAHVDSLRDPTRPSPADTFQLLRTSTNIATVTIGNAEYQMYIQPVQLSLAATDGDSDRTEEWALCGFVRADHFRAAGSAISYTYLLWFGVALATVCLAIPLLKLHILSPNERLEASDGVLVAATTFLATGLLTFCAIDAYYFHFEVNETTRAELTNAARAIRDHVNAEASAISAQMTDLRKPELWKRALSYGDELALNRLPLYPVPPKDLFTLGRYRVDGALDTFNALNSNVVLSQNQAFGSTLGQPLAVLQGRLLRLSSQIKF